MSGSAGEFVSVDVEAFDPRFSFRVDIPAEWAQLPIPDDAVDANDPEAFRPVAVFVARYGAMVLTFSVHLGFSEFSVVEWFAGACRRGGIPVGDFAPARAGQIDGVQGTGVQDSDAGPMAVRAFMFEQAGYAHILMAMAPAAVWDSLTPTYDRMFASFAMAIRYPSTVPLWPVGQLPPQQAPAVTLAGAAAVAEQFLEALKSGDAEAAKACLVPDDSGSVNFPGAGGDGAEYSLGAPQADGDVVVVPATLRLAPPGGQAPEEQTLPLVLRLVEGDWKIDMNASISRMLGFDMGEAMGQMAEGMAEGFKSAVEGLSEDHPKDDHKPK